MNSVLRGLAAGVALAGIGFASSASAATTDTADVRATILTSLAVVVSPTDRVLDFGSFADGGIAGNVQRTVNPDGSATACPALMVCSGVTNAPTFTVTGLTSGQNVQITFQNATETLTGPGGATMQVGNFTTNFGASANRIVGFDGSEDFTVGGTLTVAPAQAAGAYSGTLRVNVVYN